MDDFYIIFRNDCRSYSHYYMYYSSPLFDALGLPKWENRTIPVFHEKDHEEMLQEIGRSLETNKGEVE